MKYEFVSMHPKDKIDEIITVNCLPSWYDITEDFAYQESKTASFVGSGTQWWDQKTDKRADSWLSSILHNMWNNALNKRLEKANCKI